MNVLSRPKEPGEIVPDTLLHVLSLLDLPNEILEHILEVNWSYVISSFSLLDLPNEILEHILEVKWSYVISSFSLLDLFMLNI